MLHLVIGMPLIRRTQAMTDQIDIKKVIEDSTTVKTIQDLEREGRRAVRVVRASRISELISEAVDNVIRDRSTKAVEAERSQLIESTGREFKKLLATAESERKKSQDTQEQVTQYEKDLLQLTHKLELSEHVHEEDVRLLDEQRKTVDEMKEKVNLLKHELEQLVQRHQGEEEERQALLKETQELRHENRDLRLELKRELEQRAAATAELQQKESAAGGEKDAEAIKDLVGEVKAIRDSFEKGFGEGGAQAVPNSDQQKEMMTQLETAVQSSMDQIVQQLATQFQGMPGAAGAQPVEAAKVVLDNLFSDDAGDKSIESNLEKITVESSEGSGIGDSLQRLKKLHQMGIGGSGGDSDGAPADNDSEVSKGEHNG